MRASFAWMGLGLVACGSSGIDPSWMPGELVLAPAPAPVEPALPDGISVRALTFNLHGGQDASPEAIGQFLAGLDLDLVALQECPPELGRDLAARAGFTAVEGDGQMLLAKAPLQDFARFEVLGRSYVHATTLLGGVPFSVYSAHLGWNAVGDAQCQLFRDALEADPNPQLLVLGDFNDEHYSSQIQILDGILDEASLKYGLYPGQRISWPATGFDGGEGSQTIDLIFFLRERGVIVKSYQIGNTRPVLSDHKPVWVELLFPRPGQRFDVDPYAELRSFPWPEFSASDNLLGNPGAEDGLEGWAVSGDARAETAREEHGPAAGLRFFTGAPNLPNDALPISAISQEVELPKEPARGRYLWAQALLTTGYSLEVDGEISSNRVRPYDDGEIILETLDAGGEVLSRLSSGRRDTLGYHPFQGTLLVPPTATKARYSFWSHKKANNGGSNDAIADELFLAVAPGPEHARLGGNLIRGGDAEGPSTTAELRGFRAQADLSPMGVMLYPPWSRSGQGLLVAGEPLAQTPTPGARWAEAFSFAALEAPLAEGTLALRWGGWARTYAAGTELRFHLEILDHDGSVWGVIEAPPVFPAEWTLVENLTRIPPGASGARLVIDCDVPVEEWAFLDELYAYPEAVAPDLR